MKKTFLISLIILLTMLFYSCKSNDEKYVIGVMIPLTGKGAAAGENAKKAIDLCVEKWNNNGGILGKKIIVDYYDVKNSEPKEGVAIAKRIISKSVKTHVVLNVISGVVLSSQPILDKNKIIQISLSGSDDLFKSFPKYTIRNFNSATQVSREIIKNLIPMFNSETIKVIYPANEWGLSNIQSIRNQVNNYKIKLLAEEQYNEEELSYRNSITKCNLNDKDILYLIGSQERIGRLVKQVKESGFKGVIIGGADIKTSSALNIIGKNRDNIYYTDVDMTVGVNKLNQIFMEKYGVNMDEISIFFYNGVDLIFSAINEIGSDDNKEIMSFINNKTYQVYLGNMEVDNNEIIYPFRIKKLE